MKLTKRDKNLLLHVLNMCQRANDYIQSENIAVCLVREKASSNLDYVRTIPFNKHVDRNPSDALPLTRLCKEVGSDLACLPTAIRQLKIILDINPN